MSLYKVRKYYKQCIVFVLINYLVLVRCKYITYNSNASDNERGYPEVVNHPSHDGDFNIFSYNITPNVECDAYPDKDYGRSSNIILVCKNDNVPVQLRFGANDYKSEFFVLTYQILNGKKVLIDKLEIYPGHNAKLLVCLNRNDGEIGRLDVPTEKDIKDIKQVRCVEFTLWVLEKTFDIKKEAYYKLKTYVGGKISKIIPHDNINDMKVECNFDADSSRICDLSIEGNGHLLVPFDPYNSKIDIIINDPSLVKEPVFLKIGKNTSKNVDINDLEYQLNGVNLGTAPFVTRLDLYNIEGGKKDNISNFVLTTLNKRSMKRNYMLLNIFNTIEPEPEDLLMLSSDHEDDNDIVYFSEPMTTSEFKLSDGLVKCPDTRSIIKRTGNVEMNIVISGKNARSHVNVQLLSENHKLYINNWPIKTKDYKLSISNFNKLKIVNINNNQSIALTIINQGGNTNEFLPMVSSVVMAVNLISALVSIGPVNVVDGLVLLNIAKWYHVLGIIDMPFLYINRKIQLFLRGYETILITKMVLLILLLDLLIVMLIFEGSNKKAVEDLKHTQKVKYNQLGLTLIKRTILFLPRHLYNIYQSYIPGRSSLFSLVIYNSLFLLSLTHYRELCSKPFEYLYMMGQKFKYRLIMRASLVNLVVLAILFTRFSYKYIKDLKKGSKLLTCPSMLSLDEESNTDGSMIELNDKSYYVSGSNMSQSKKIKGFFPVRVNKVYSEMTRMSDKWFNIFSKKTVIILKTLKLNGKKLDLMIKLDNEQFINLMTMYSHLDVWVSNKKHINYITIDDVEIEGYYQETVFKFILMKSLMLILVGYRYYPVLFGILSIIWFYAGMNLYNKEVEEEYMVEKGMNKYKGKLMPSESIMGKMLKDKTSLKVKDRRLNNSIKYIILTSIKYLNSSIFLLFADKVNIFGFILLNLSINLTFPYIQLVRLTDMSMHLIEYNVYLHHKLYNLLQFLYYNLSNSLSSIMDVIKRRNYNEMTFNGIAMAEVMNKCIPDGIKLYNINTRVDLNGEVCKLYKQIYVNKILYNYGDVTNRKNIRRLTIDDFNFDIDINDLYGKHEYLFCLIQLYNGGSKYLPLYLGLDDNPGEEIVTQLNVSAVDSFYLTLSDINENMDKYSYNTSDSSSYVPPTLNSSVNDARSDEIPGKKIGNDMSTNYGDSSFILNDTDPRQGDPELIERAPDLSKTPRYLSSTAESDYITEQIPTAEGLHEILYEYDRNELLINGPFIQAGMSYTVRASIRDGYKGDMNRQRVVVNTKCTFIGELSFKIVNELNVNEWINITCDGYNDHILIYPKKIFMERIDDEITIYHSELKLGLNYTVTYTSIINKVNNGFVWNGLCMTDDNELRVPIKLRAGEFNYICYNYYVTKDDGKTCSITPVDQERRVKYGIKFPSGIENCDFYDSNFGSCNFNNNTFTLFDELEGQEEDTVRVLTNVKISINTNEFSNIPPVPVKIINESSNEFVRVIPQYDHFAMELEAKIAKLRAFQNHLNTCDELINPQVITTFLSPENLKDVLKYGRSNKNDFIEETPNIIRDSSYHPSEIPKDHFTTSRSDEELGEDTSDVEYTHRHPSLSVAKYTSSSSEVSSVFLLSMLKIVVQFYIVQLHNIVLLAWDHHKLSKSAKVRLLMSKCDHLITIGTSSITSILDVIRTEASATDILLHESFEFPFVLNRKKLVPIINIKLQLKRWKRQIERFLMSYNRNINIKGTYNIPRHIDNSPKFPVFDSEVGGLPHSRTSDTFSRNIREVKGDTTGRDINPPLSTEELNRVNFILSALRNELFDYEAVNDSIMVVKVPSNEVICGCTHGYLKMIRIDGSIKWLSSLAEVIGKRLTLRLTERLSVNINESKTNEISCNIDCINHYKCSEEIKISSDLSKKLPILINFQVVFDEKINIKINGKDYKLDNSIEFRCFSDGIIKNL